MKKSHLLVIVAALCLIISGCSGGAVEDISPVYFPDTPTPTPTPIPTPPAPAPSDVTESMDQELPDCETLYGADGYWDNCQGDLTLLNGDQYVGEWKNGKEHGQGTITWVDGAQYVGEWKDGLFHGQGTYTHANGDQEEGIWEEGECVECVETSN